MREIFSMNPGWRFLLHEGGEQTSESMQDLFDPAPEGNESGNHARSQVGYPDQEWLAVDLPHNIPFSSRAEANRGSLSCNGGWYRKTFFLPASDEGRRIHIEFEGLFPASQVWINGHVAHDPPNGDTGFSCDVSERLHYGTHNTLAVRSESGGISRDVRLVKTDPVRVDGCGILIQTTCTTLHLETTVRNDGPEAAHCVVQSVIIDANECAVVVAQTPITIESKEAVCLEQAPVIPSPICWSPETPYLYTLITVIRLEDQIVDEYKTPFGMKEVHFDDREGFLLNGKPLKIHGIYTPQDHAGVGRALPAALQEWRIRQLKRMGVNALRVSHHPPGPALLEICDRLGIMVINEIRDLIPQDATMDRYGFPTDAYFYYQSQWNPEPMLHLFPHWNWDEREGQPIYVRAYTNCAEMELILNGQSIARESVATTGYFERRITYEPGTLEAIGYGADGNEILRTTLETVGKPAAIRLTAEGDGLFIGNAEIVDSQGRWVPTAEHLITYSIQGHAKILETGLDAPNGKVSTAFGGRHQVLIQSLNEKECAFLRAEAEGLEPCVLKLTSTLWKKPAAIPGLLEPVEPIPIDYGSAGGLL
ncbi:MAG: DUF4982 domain-containing protein [Pontiella sp.]